MNRPMDDSQPAAWLTWTRRSAAALLGLIAVAGFGLAAGMMYGHGKIDARVAALGEQLGIALDLNHVDLGFGRPTTAYQVTARVPDGGPQVAMRSVRANLDLLALVRGERRPSDTTIRGLRLSLRIADRKIVGLAPVIDAWRARRKGTDSGPARASGAMTVHLEDARVHVAIDEPLLPGIDALVVSQLEGSVTRDRGALDVSFSGVVTVDGRTVRGTVSATVDDGALVSAELVLSERLWLPLALPRGDGRQHRVLVSLLRAVRDADKRITEVFGLQIRDGIHSAGAEHIALTDDGAPLPRPANITQVSVVGGAVTRGKETASAKTLKINLQPPPSADGQGAGRKRERLPRLRQVEATEASATLPSRGLSASVKSVKLRFADIALGTLASLDRDGLVDALDAVSLQAPTASITAPKDGLANLIPARLRARLGLDAGTDTTEPTVEDPMALPTVPVEVGTTDDPMAGVGGGRLERLVKLARRLPIAITDALVEVQERGVGPVMTLDNMSLKLTPEPHGSLGVAVDAMVVRGGTPTGQIKVATTLDAKGRPQGAKGLIAGQDVAHMVAKFSSYVNVPQSADVEVAFEWQPPTPDDPRHRLKGKTKLNNFGFEAWRIAHVPITGIEGEVSYALTYDPQRRHLELDLPAIRVKKATMRAKLSLTRGDGDRKPVFAVQLAMPKQDCADVRASIPAALLPRLSGLKVRGSMWFDARLAVDMDKPKELTLDVKGSMEACDVLTLGEIDVADLRSKKWVHYPVEPKQGERKDIPVGPGTPYWVPSRSLPRLVKAAAIVTEDRSFWKHGGIRWVLVRRALKLNLKHGRFVYGGSTITQQLVKNLYLTREKALSRKLEEAIIAMQMERVLTKDEILTIYVNVVEFGPDIYGVKRAARHYFGKHPRHLSPLEAAFIMGLKPWPRGGYKQWNNGSVNAYWVKRLEHILSMMQRIEGAISEEEVIAAAPYQPKFRPKGASYKWGKPYQRPDEL